MAARIAPRRAPSRGRAATIVRSTTRPASRRPRSGRPPRPAGRAVDAGGVDGPAGNRRPRSPRPAAPSSASATAWSATSPSEWPCSRGAPAIAMPPGRAARPARTGASRGRSAGRAGPCRRPSASATRGEVGGQRHLEIARVAGDDMDGDGTGLEQRGLIGPGLRSVGRVALERGAEHAGPDALRRLRRGQPVAVDGPDDPTAVDPLQGLGDRQRPGSRRRARRWRG